ncbi:MAG: stage II sporulation protein M [Deltaproteobacteria bacterium]|jgi:uncharacterized membrane protein SpoIIM required for sporulation|nr:stage II sporulation protein M [Deltaproteobacteria bacterium]
MTKSFFNTAWKWLFIQLVVTTFMTYFILIVLVELEWLTPLHVFKTATLNIRLFTGGLLDTGQSLGIDLGVMIFFCNLSGAIMIVLAFYSVVLFKPTHSQAQCQWLRRRLLRESSHDLLQVIPFFSKIKRQELRATSFILLAAPVLSTLCLGLLAGTLLAAVHSVSGSSILAMAYILPHGFAELMAYLLACSVPLGTWFAVYPALEQNDPTLVFQRIDQIANSEALQGHLKIMINMFLIAGLVETHLTQKVIALLNNF